ncbi:COP23 domain-containing protein [Myxosarcina sp. GI1(2024)]
MKLRSLVGMLAGMSFVLGGAIVSPLASLARVNNNTYYCAQLNGKWNTFVNTPRGRVTLIEWANSFSDRWTPKTRCLEISRRFQQFLDKGNLKYIRTGSVNQQPVICVAEARNGQCPDPNVLITLKQGTDPEVILVRLVDFRRSVSGQTLTLSADDPGFYSDGEFYVDLERFLEKVPVNE